MSKMVHHQCFRGIDCYSSLQKLFTEIFFDFGAMQTWSTWVATYGYYIDDFALIKMGTTQNSFNLLFYRKEDRLFSRRTW